MVRAKAQYSGDTNLKIFLVKQVGSTLISESGNFYTGPLNRNESCEDLIKTGKPWSNNSSDAIEFEYSFDSSQGGLLIDSNATSGPASQFKLMAQGLIDEGCSGPPCDATLWLIGTVQISVSY